MKFLIVALAIVSVCFAQSDDDWVNFQRKYGKNYRSIEVANRRANWEKNWKIIKQHNEEYAKGLHTYTLGENEFADMSFDEFSAQYLGLDAKVLKSLEEHQRVHQVGETRAPASIDLRNLGIVPAVKNQGSCGSCWAFAAVATVEGAWARAKNVAPPNLSEQQLVDCSKGFDEDGDRSNYGCSGGWIDYTYQDIIQTGLQGQTSYPYTGKDGACKYDSKSVIAKITDYAVIRNENQLIDAVGSQNLVNVAMYVSSKFQMYKSGIYSSSAAEDMNQVNHAVTVVGYDTASTGGYILVKNSWGATWGEKGFFRVQIGKQALSIGKWGAYPIV